MAQEPEKSKAPVVNFQSLPELVVARIGSHLGQNIDNTYNFLRTSKAIYKVSTNALFWQSAFGAKFPMEDTQVNHRSVMMKRKALSLHLNRPRKFFERRNKKREKVFGYLLNDDARNLFKVFFNTECCNLLDEDDLRLVEGEGSPFLTDKWKRTGKLHFEFTFEFEEIARYISLARDLRAYNCCFLMMRILAHCMEYRAFYEEKNSPKTFFLIRNILSECSEKDDFYFLGKFYAILINWLKYPAKLVEILSNAKPQALQVALNEADRDKVNILVFYLLEINNLDLLGKLLLHNPSLKESRIVESIVASTNADPHQEDKHTRQHPEFFGRHYTAHTFQKQSFSKKLGDMLIPDEFSTSETEFVNVDVQRGIKTSIIELAQKFSGRVSNGGLENIGNIDEMLKMLGQLTDNCAALKQLKQLDPTAVDVTETNPSPQPRTV